MAVSKRIVLHFPRSLVDQAIVFRLVKDYSLVFNILKASVTPREEGLLVLELSGEDAQYENAMKFLAGVGVGVQPLSQDVVRNETRCIHCGACVGFCPGGALEINRTTMIVEFRDDKCIACGLCIKACPQRAMTMSL